MQSLPALVVLGETTPIHIVVCLCKEAPVAQGSKCILDRLVCVTLVCDWGECERAGCSEMGAGLSVCLFVRVRMLPFLQLDPSTSSVAIPTPTGTKQTIQPKVATSTV